MLHIIESHKSVQEIEKSFPEIVSKHKFGILGVHNLKKKMNEKGVAFERDCLIFEICNPQQAKKVLEENMSISTALPCRVSLYKDNGKTKLATIKPTALIELYSSPKLKSTAEEIEKTLIQIMKELAE